MSPTVGAVGNAALGGKLSAAPPPPAAPLRAVICLSPDGRGKWEAHVKVRSACKGGQGVWGPNSWPPSCCVGVLCANQAAASMLAGKAFVLGINSPHVCAGAQ